MTRSAILEGELAAYSPCEMAAFAETVSILLEAADDGTLAFCEARARIQVTLAKAVDSRMKAERKAARTATVIQFPRSPR